MLNLRLRAFGITLCVLQCLFISITIWSESEHKEPFIIPGPDLDFWEIGFTPGFRGLSPLPNLDTVFWLGGKISYKNFAYMRNPDNSVYLETPNNNIRKYKSWVFNWETGISQGIVYNPIKKKNLFQFSCFYQGYESNNIETQSPESSLWFQSQLPEKNYLIEHSLIFGFEYLGIHRKSPSPVKKGMDAELSLRMAPKELGNDISDYNQIHFHLKNHFILFEQGRFTFSLGDCIMLDYLFGDYIPFHVRCLFGGFDPEYGLGNQLRGYKKTQYDGNIKLVNSFDLRFSLFDILTIPIVVPFDFLFWQFLFNNPTFSGVFVLTCDIGYSDNLTNKIDFSNPFYTAGFGIGFTMDDHAIVGLMDFIFNFYYNFQLDHIEFSFMTSYHF